MLIAVSITFVNNALLNWLLRACGDCIVAEAQCSSCATGTGITRQGAFSVTIINSQTLYPHTHAHALYRSYSRPNDAIPSGKLHQPTV